MRFKSILLALLLSLACLGPSQGLTPVPIDDATKEDVLSAINDIFAQRAFVPGIDLKNWPAHLAAHKDAIDKAQTQSDFISEINRAIREFGVSHVHVSSPMTSEMRTRTSVVGVGLSARPEKDGLVVTRVFPQSPAGQVGIEVGDKILEIDGKPADDPSLLSGDLGTEVTLKIKSDKGAEREVKLRRERIRLARHDTLTWRGDDTAILTIHSFSRYDRGAVEKMMLDAAKAKFLVLDLRRNGGGATDNLSHLLSLLLPPQTNIGTFVGRATVRFYVDETHRDGADPVEIAKWDKMHFTTTKLDMEPFKGKVAVLINGGSASASEICACALRENLKAPLIGQKSMGAVLASVFNPLPHGFEIQYPVMDYVSSQFVRLEGHPLVPDYEVTPPAGQADDGSDPTLDKAIEVLKRLAALKRAG